jgi:hypothetical protein
LKTSVLFVCRSNKILDMGIYSILNAAHSRLLIQVIPDNITNFLKAVAADPPDVIILSQRSNTARHSLFKNLLTSLHPIRILTVCTESNHVSVYQSQVVQVQKTNDLVNLIQSSDQQPITRGTRAMENIQSQLKQLSTLYLNNDEKEEYL